MKMIVIIDKQGQLVAAQESNENMRGQVAGIAAGPDQQAHVIDVPDDVVQLTDPSAFSSRIVSLVSRA